MSTYQKTKKCVNGWFMGQFSILIVTLEFIRLPEIINARGFFLESSVSPLRVLMAEPCSEQATINPTECILQVDV